MQARDALFAVIAAGLHALPGAMLPRSSTPPTVSEAETSVAVDWAPPENVLDRPTSPPRLRPAERELLAGPPRPSKGTGRQTRLSPTRGKAPGAQSLPLKPTALAPPKEITGPDTATTTTPDTPRDLLSFSWSMGGGGGSSGLFGRKELSRAASLGGPKHWTCPFPPGTDSVEHAWVRVVARVAADGHALKVTVVEEPIVGFARYAAACAMLEHYVPGRDAEGRPTEASTLPFRVFYNRW